MKDDDIPHSLTPWQKIMRRTFDVVFATFGVIITGWLICLAYLAARIDTGRSGFFLQKRVGRYGEIFQIIKIRTMRVNAAYDTDVTTTRDSRVTDLGNLFRQFKIDELPQLINILRGDMSFVGPRPDVPGYADELEGKARVILSVRPGVTGPATLAFPNEEELLSDCENPERVNDKLLYPKKVEINREYLENYSFTKDLYCIVQTVLMAVGLTHPPDRIDLEALEDK